MVMKFVGLKHGESPNPKCRTPLYIKKDEEIVYSPNKYRETEGLMLGYN